jgi:hypothetical protein
VKAQCRAGCGDLGDPELDYLCVDCHGDQVELHQQQDLRKYMAKEASVADSAEQEQPSSSSPPSPVRKYRGPRPVDHAKGNVVGSWDSLLHADGSFDAALEDFLNQHREQDANVVARELSFLKREITVRETSKKQLRKYMVATDEEEQVDPKEWGRYEFGPPKAVPTRDVEEAVELAAQLKLFCRWRKRAVQRRIASRRQQSEVERLAQKKQKKKGVIVPSLSLGTLRGSTKTAVEQESPAPVKQPTVQTRRVPILKAWHKKTNR